MKNTFIHSLAFKIGFVIILVELLALSITGGFYIKRFSQEVDRRVEARVQIPGQLMADGSLNYSLVANRQRLERLLGQEVEEGIVLSVAQQVFYSLHPENVGKHVTEIPGLRAEWFDPAHREPFLEHLREDGENYLVSVTPILAMDGRAPFLFMYLKINTNHAEAEKATINRLFLLGSFVTIVVTSLAIFLIFERAMFLRIRALLQVFKGIEEGDLTLQADGRIVPDEIGSLQHGVNSMVARLREKAELEKQLQKAQKMEAVGTLAGGISHDFNNILGGIIGYTELAQDEIPPEMHSQHYLSQILKACYRAKDLILQILSFARQSAVERQALELNSIVKETLKLLKVTLPEHITLRYSLKSRSSLVTANPTQIHQTIMNLCMNAVHAMEDSGGVLNLTIQDLDIMDDDPRGSQHVAAGQYIKLSISDTGPGMNPEILQRIFDPYFTTKTPYEGTGLGLSICQGIIENHGGAISVDSTPGEGSTFTILLPKRDESQNVEGEGLMAVGRELYGNERVLYVDDEAFLIEIGQDMLEQLGYQVTTAMNGEEALEQFQARADQFDLVMTDQTMPKMTGAELAKRMLDIRPDIPIILCTGFSENLTEEQAKEIGIREFLLKPLSRQEMALAVRRVLESQ